MVLKSRGKAQSLRTIFSCLTGLSSRQFSGASFLFLSPPETNVSLFTSLQVSHQSHSSDNDTTKLVFLENHLAVSWSTKNNSRTGQVWEVTATVVRYWTTNSIGPWSLRKVKYTHSPRLPSQKEFVDCSETKQGGCLNEMKRQSSEIKYLEFVEEDTREESAAQKKVPEISMKFTCGSWPRLGTS